MAAWCSEQPSNGGVTHFGELAESVKGHMVVVCQATWRMTIAVWSKTLTRPLGPGHSVL